MSHKIKIEVELDDEFLEDVLTTAVEGGTNYWAKVDLNKRDPETLRCIEITFYDAEADSPNDENFPPMLVNAEVIARGIQRILSTGLVNDQIYDCVSKGVRENDAGYIDAEAADCIVQAALFNEIVYG